MSLSFFIIIAAPLPCSLFWKKAVTVHWWCFSLCGFLRQAQHQDGNFVTFWQWWDCIEQSELEEIQICRISPYSRPQIYPQCKQLGLKGFYFFSSLRSLYTYAWLSVKGSAQSTQKSTAPSCAAQRTFKASAHSPKCLHELQLGWKGLWPPLHSVLCVNRQEGCMHKVKVKVRVRVRVTVTVWVKVKVSVRVS